MCGGAWTCGAVEQVADQLGDSQTSTTLDDYIGRKIRKPGRRQGPSTTRFGRS
jgi:hypothetical protein